MLQLNDLKPDIRQTCETQQLMSAIGGKADMRQTLLNVRF